MAASCYLQEESFCAQLLHEIDTYRDGFEEKQMYIAHALGSVHNSIFHATVLI